MNQSLLIILAYNESLNIENVILEVHDQFEKILIIDDCSKDATNLLIQNMKRQYQNLDLISNKKNLGAGRSLQIAIDHIKSHMSEIDFIVKIDGDGQFLRKDILKIKEILISNNVGLVKSNRFWSDGIIGNIPLIRYLGNSFASFLIKVNTGLLKINDPLNGLFGFNKEFLKKIEIPDLFKRYGYPFYINSFGVLEKVKIVEIENTVRYDTGANSQLKAFKMFFKLTIFSITHFFKNLSSKLKDANLQVSAVLDVFFLALQSMSFYSIYKLFYIRLVSLDGIQSNWLIIFIILQIFSYVIFYYSKFIENRYRESFFTYY